jgi:hypothetical protein
MRSEKAKHRVEKLPATKRILQSREAVGSTTDGFNSGGVGTDTAPSVAVESRSEPRVGTEGDEDVLSSADDAIRAEGAAGTVKALTRRSILAWNKGKEEKQKRKHERHERKYSGTEDVPKGQSSQMNPPSR